MKVSILYSLRFVCMFCVYEKKLIEKGLLSQYSSCFNTQCILSTENSLKPSLRSLVCGNQTIFAKLVVLSIISHVFLGTDNTS